VNVPAPAPGERTRDCAARVRGRVQGVGYRESCVRQANALGVTGWVRNRVDGSVEVRLQGPAEAVERMCDWLRHGPAMARVEEASVSELPPPVSRFERFERRATE
jgi:acylphosphatase